MGLVPAPDAFLALVRNRWADDSPTGNADIARSSQVKISGGFMAKQVDPTKDAEFKRILVNLLKAPPKPHSEMKLGKAKLKKKKKTKG